MLSQLTRAPEREERKPQLSDLRESGAIEQDADVVLFINRPNFYKTDLPEEDRAKSELIIAKQRNGPTGTMNFVFLAATRDSKRPRQTPGAARSATNSVVVHPQDVSSLRRFPRERSGRRFLAVPPPANFCIFRAMPEANLRATIFGRAR